MSKKKIESDSFVPTSSEGEQLPKVEQTLRNDPLTRVFPIRQISGMMDLLFATTSHVESDGDGQVDRTEFYRSLNLSIHSVRRSFSVKAYGSAESTNRKCEYGCSGQVETQHPIRVKEATVVMGLV